MVAPGSETTHDMSNDHGSSKPLDHDMEMARRQLLRLAVYTPPMIMGTMLVSRAAYAASCVPISCAPTATKPQPCAPFPSGRPGGGS